MASPNHEVSASEDSYAEVFQVLTVVVPFCPHKTPHRIDINSERFQGIISRAVHAALAQYVREENALDRLERTEARAAAAAPHPGSPLGGDDASRETEAAAPEEAVIPVLEASAASSSENSEDTSSIVWAPAMGPVSDESESTNASAHILPAQVIPDDWEHRQLLNHQAPGQRAFLRGIRQTSSPAPDSLPDLSSHDDLSEVSAVLPIQTMEVTPVSCSADVSSPDYPF